MSDVLRSAGLECSTISQESSERRLKKPTLLLGIGTAVPEYSADQDQSFQFMRRVLEAAGVVESSQVPFLKRLYKNSAIGRRHSIIRDYILDDPEEFTFFPNNQALDPFPRTAARMARYEEHAVDLAAEAAQKAIDTAGIAPEEFTHIVISTCTGFFAPGPDVLLLRRLGLPTTTARTVLGFMGCYAGLSALRTCHEITQADSNAVVLQIAVELCSLHYQKTGDPDALVANAIFADGAGAAIWASAESAAGKESSAVAQVLATHSDISPDTIEHMSWRIGDHGFIMKLDAGIPDVLRDAAPQFVDALANVANLSTADITGWAIHPGGRKIVDSVRDSLGLTPGDVAASMNVLRDYGNMSSATILFVLQEELARRQPGEAVAALGFGPGLTMEGALLARE